MAEYAYNSGQQPDSTEYDKAAFIQALHNQHASALDDLVRRHVLWLPELFYPTINAVGVIRTQIRLQDGRKCDVITFSATGQTIVTDWGSESLS